MSQTDSQSAGLSEEQHLAMVADVVSAYISNNKVDQSGLIALIADVNRAFSNLTSGAEAPMPEPLRPAVPVKKSVMPDYIICLEDGQKFRSLKRHLRAKYGMSPAEYRQRWGLPADYPMVAPSYSEQRSVLAKKAGLGQAQRASVEARRAGKATKAAGKAVQPRRPGKAKKA